MSAFHPKATEQRTQFYVGFVPNRTHAPQQTEALFDHLVGAGDERRRKVEAKCLGRLQIDDEVELRGLQYRQITRFLALEGTSSVNANLSIGVSNETLPAGYHPQPRPERRPCKK